MGFSQDWMPIILQSQERSVENTLRLIGLTINSDKRLEVLFTSAIMRGFRWVISIGFNNFNSWKLHKTQNSKRLELDKITSWWSSLWSSLWSSCRWWSSLLRDDVVTVHSSTNNDLSTVRPSLAQRLPDLLTGTQLSLLLHRYLEYTRVEVIRRSSSKSKSLKDLLLSWKIHIFYLMQLF